jgi:hypothetical protein
MERSSVILSSSSRYPLRRLPSTVLINAHLATRTSGSDRACRGTLRSGESQVRKGTVLTIVHTYVLHTYVLHTYVLHTYVLHTYVLHTYVLAHHEGSVRVTSHHTPEYRPRRQELNGVSRAVRCTTAQHEYVSE